MQVRPPGGRRPEIAEILAERRLESLPDGNGAATWSRALDLLRAPGCEPSLRFLVSYVVSVDHMELLVASLGAAGLLTCPSLALQASKNPPAPPPYEPFVVQQLEPAEAHGFALHLAKTGDLERALAALAELVRKEAGASEQVSRDLARAKGFLELRNAWLENLHASGAKTSFEIDGQRVIAAIDRIEEGTVYFKPNPKKVESIPLDSLEPGFVAAETDKEQKKGDTPSWVRAWGFALAGDPRGEKMLKQAPEELALAEDLRTRYPDLLRTGEAAAALIALAGRGEPASVEEATGCLSAVTRLCQEYGPLPLVERHKSALARFAELVAFRAYSPLSPSELLRGSFQDLGDGRVRLVYEFDSPREAEDFSSEPRYFSSWRQKLPEPDLPVADSNWTVSNGSFGGVGAACYRHRISFTAPMTLRVKFRSHPGSVVETVAAMLLALCSDADKDYIHCTPTGHLSIYDEKNHYAKAVDGSKDTMFFDTDYVLDVRHDGKTVSTWLDEEKMAELPAGFRTSGSVLVWFHTNSRKEIDRLEIEGHVDHALLRQLWIDQKLKEAGLR